MQKLVCPPNLEPYVKEIILLESHESNALNSFPFYADGFAGIAFSRSAKPFYLQPRNKQLSNFYLFGQTIEPMSLDIEGSFKLIALRLYPFAVRILLGIDPKILNDDCFDLLDVENVNTYETLERLEKTDDNGRIIKIINDYFSKLLANASSHPDYRIKLAVNLIIKENGRITIKSVRERLHISERTFERHFLKEIGVTPKQFAKIIQFSASVKQITEADYINLTEIGYDNGFADQSHFIRTFKKFTGRTPKEIQRQLAS